MFRCKLNICISYHLVQRTYRYLLTVALVKRLLPLPYSPLSFPYLSLPPSFPSIPLSIDVINVRKKYTNRSKTCFLSQK